MGSSPISGILVSEKATPKGFEPLRAEPNGFLEESLIHALGTHSKLVELLAQISIIVKTEVRRDFGK